MLYWMSAWKQDVMFPYVKDIVHFFKLQLVKGQGRAKQHISFLQVQNQIIEFMQLKNIPASINPSLACYLGHNAEIPNIFVIWHQFLEGSKALQSFTISCEAPGGTGILTSL